MALTGNLTTVYWINPELCTPPHRVTHQDRFNDLSTAMQRERGYSVYHHPLIGYENSEPGTFTLITGSHRWAVCASNGFEVPILLQSQKYLQDIWGTQDWVDMCCFAVPILRLNWVEFQPTPEWGFNA